MSRRGWVVLATLVVALFSRPAMAVGRDGQGRISLAGGGTWITDNPLTQNARAAGYDVEQTFTFGPIGMATFGYWFDQHFELSIEGGYQHDSYGVRGKKDLTLDSEFLMATLRWSFVGGYDLWPYVGASFGCSFHGVSSPFALYGDSWSAEGYGEAAEVGLGIDLSNRFGVSFELRYTLTLLQTQFPSSLNAGGLSLLVGVYLRIPRSHQVNVIRGSP